MSKRIWDKIDEQASREGEAIRKIASYSPTHPHISSPLRIPKRLYTNGLCYRIEHLSNSTYKKLHRKGLLKTV